MSLSGVATTCRASSPPVRSRISWIVPRSRSEFSTQLPLVASESRRYRDILDDLTSVAGLEWESSAAPAAQCAPRGTRRRSAPASLRGDPPAGAAALAGSRLRTALRASPPRRIPRRRGRPRSRWFRFRRNRGATSLHVPPTVRASPVDRRSRGLRERDRTCIDRPVPTTPRAAARCGKVRGDCRSGIPPDSRQSRHLRSCRLPRPPQARRILRHVSTRALHS